MSTPCDYYGCEFEADSIFYPNARRQQQLAVALCLGHAEDARSSVLPKDNLYQTVTRYVRKSLVQT